MSLLCRDNVNKLPFPIELNAKFVFRFTHELHIIVRTDVN